MPSGNLDSEIDILNVLKSTFMFLFTCFILWVLWWGYFNAYNPKKRAYIKKTNYAYSVIEQEALEYYRENGKIYKDKNDTIDEFCSLLVRKYANGTGDCAVGAPGLLRANFVFQKSKITIYGFERQPFEMGGVLVKDFIIDINGDEGDNEMGVDRVPVRLHSQGRLGGILSPVNCSHEDLKDYDIPYSPMCPNGVETNFYAQTIPFGYNVAQIGGEHGKTKYINRNISFARADCNAFGGELINSEDYCDAKGYYWLSSCYDEFPCAVELSKQ